MADRYWVGDTGTWDAATTTNWSETSGGAPHLPTRGTHYTLIITQTVATILAGYLVQVLLLHRTCS